MGDATHTMHVKICSARGLCIPRSKAWVQVCLKVGDIEFTTAFKKCSCRDVITLFWNKTFEFSIRTETLLTLTVKSKKEEVLGCTTVSIPCNPGEFQDRWEPLQGSFAQAGKPAEIHFVLQLEESQLDLSPLSLTAQPPLATQQSTIRPGFQGSKHSKALRQEERPSGNVHAETTVSNCNFDNHATAATMNELVESLQEVKRKIEAEILTSLSSPPKERLAMLSETLDTLSSIRSQLENEVFLEQGWKDRFIAVTDAYSSQVNELLETAAWAGVKSRADSLTSPASKEQGNHFNEPSEFIPVLKSHVIHTLEAFDDLVERGFATTILENGDGTTPLIMGMEAEISYRGFLWDPARAIMLSFADSESSGNLKFLVADTAEDEQEVPYGLRIGLVGLVENARFSITITPALAYGGSGGKAGSIPPNTHVLYEGTVLKVRSAEVPASASDMRPGRAARKQSVGRQRFSGRANRVSLTMETSLSPPRRPIEQLPHLPEDKSSPVPPPIPVRRKPVSK